MLKIFVPFLFFLSFYFLSARSEVKKLFWFTNTNCNKLIITKYKSESNQDVVATVSINDTSVIKEIMDRVSALPQGDKMKSWGPKTKYKVLSFICDDGKANNIPIYDDKFQTPSTGFIADNNSAEQALAQDIESMVVPVLNVKIPKIKNYPVRFKNFMINFTGNKHIPQPETGPIVGQANENYFSIQENNSANEVKIVIFDGQTPPQPQAFTVGGKIYYLLTYQGLKGELLYPKYFIVSDKLPINVKLID